MDAPPRIGTVHQLSFEVESSHAITFAGLPPVLSSPWLIWFMEHAALDLVAPFLSDGELSVGTGVEFDHQSPAVVGEPVTCSARLILVDGNTLTFQCEAVCHGRILSRGLHKRAIVDRERVRRRLEALG